MSFIGIANNIWRDTQGTGGSGAWVLAPGGVVATLDIDFVNNRAWNSPAYVPISSILSCTRATPPLATYIDASGGIQYFAPNILRYGTNGLLVEPQRTNSILQTTDFGAVIWQVSQTTITTNVTVAPDGTLTADKHTPNAVANRHYIFQSVGVSATVTYSILAKSDGSNAQLWLGDNGGGALSFFTLSGSGTATGAGAISLIGNGWYRCSVVSEPTILNDFWLGVGFNNDQFAAGNGVDGVYIWGAQIESGLFATSYIPTAATSATRAADIVNGTTFTFYNQTAGAFYTASTQFGNASNPALFAVDDGTFNEFMDMDSTSPTNTRFNVVDGGVGQAAPNVTVNGLNTANKIAAAYAVNDFVIVANGGVPSTDNTGTLPTPTTLRIGNVNQASPMSGYIRRFTYWNSRLSNANLQLVTT